MCDGMEEWFDEIEEKLDVVLKYQQRLARALRVLREATTEEELFRTWRELNDMIYGGEDDGL